MPDENEQNALTKIKAYLDTGRSLESLREAGWATWIDHLLGKGYNLRTGQLDLVPPDTQPPDELFVRAESADPPPQAKRKPNTFASFIGNVAGFLLDGLAWWWRWATSRQTKWVKFIAIAGPPLTAIIVVAVIAGALGGDGDSEDEGELASSATDRSSSRSSQQGDELGNDQPQPDISVETTCLEFLDGFLGPLIEAEDSMTQISDLTLQAVSDPLVAATSAWQEDIRTMYVRLRNGRADIAALEAPNSELVAVKAQFLESFDLMLASESPLLTGGANQDPDSLELSTDYLIRAATAMAIASSMGVSAC